MQDAKYSFIYMSSIELFKKDKDKSWGELDLICIKDGKFIIGEIKQSVDLFDANDFKRMEEVATILKPDIILFSSMNENPNKHVSDNIDALQINLTHLQIEVKWYSIYRYAFEAAPVR